VAKQSDFPFYFFEVRPNCAEYNIHIVFKQPSLPYFNSESYTFIVNFRSGLIF